MTPGLHYKHQIEHLLDMGEDMSNHDMQKIIKGELARMERGERSGVEKALFGERAAAPSPVAQPQELTSPKMAMPRHDAVFECLVQHFHTKGIQQRPLRRVVEDDCDWRFADDGSELSHDWTVIAWRDIPNVGSASPVAQDEREALTDDERLMLDLMTTTLNDELNEALMSDHGCDVTDVLQAQYSLLRKLARIARTATPEQDTDTQSLLSLLADIRAAAGDPHGKLMQDELIEHIKALAAQDKQDAVDAAIGRFLLNYGEWVRRDNGPDERFAHLALRLKHEDDLSCKASRRDAAIAAMQAQGEKK